MDEICISDDQEPPLEPPNHERVPLVTIGDHSTFISEQVPLDRSEAYLSKTMKKKYRWLMLFFANTVLVGSYFCYDYPAFLEVQIEEYFNITADKYSLLYSCYSIPNIVLPLFAGVLYDKYGASKVILVCSFFIMLGQGIITAGAYYLNFDLMLVGRFMYGIGAENLLITLLIVEWFLHFELNLSMGLSEILPLCASLSAGLVIPTAYNMFDLEQPNECFLGSFSIGFGLATFSFLSMVAMHCLDVKMRRHDKKLLEKQMMALSIE